MNDVDLELYEGFDYFTRKLDPVTVHVTGREIERDETDNSDNDNCNNTFLTRIIEWGKTVCLDLALKYITHKKKGWNKCTKINNKRT